MTHWYGIDTPIYQHNAYQWVMSHVSMTYLSHKYVFTDTCDMTHWYAWYTPLSINVSHDSLMRHRHVWHDSLMRHRHVWYDSLICVEYLNLSTQRISMSHGTRIHESWYTYLCISKHARQLGSSKRVCGFVDVCDVFTFYVHPIDFENAQGNLGLANALFDHRIDMCGILGLRMTFDMCDAFAF